MVADEISQLLSKIFNRVLETETILIQWHTSEIILLHKKGSRTHIYNYLPISLSSNVGKIFHKILKERIYNIFDSQQPMEQAGFRKNYSTTF